VNPTTARRARRAVPPLLVLAAVATLAAPAYANRPPDQTPVGSGAGQTVAAVRNPSDKDLRPETRDVVVISNPGSGGDGGRAAIASPPADPSPVDSVTSQIATVRNPSDKDPWPDPPVLDIDVSGDGSTKNGPNAASASPPPDPPPVDSVTAVTTAAVAGPPPVLVEE
jgi:hypothetical protein